MKNLPEVIQQKYAYIWLQRVLGPGNAKSFEIMERFSGAENICIMDEAELKSCGAFSPAELKRARNIDRSSVLEVIDYCDSHSIRIITPLSDEYPPGFGFIEAPPLVIYARGEKLLRDKPHIAMVGTRKCSDFGLKAAYSLSARLALSGFTVVSGGAIGIDSMVHRGTMIAGGKTVAVLGAGIDNNYLKSNKALRDKIEASGTVISELEPKAPASKYTFPIRNRLISALSSGVIVIEAGEKSGALITAVHAMEQGKEVFTLPGGITDGYYAGNNSLLRDGAIPVITADDIISVYVGRFTDKLNLKNSLTPEIRRAYLKVLEEQEASKAKKAPAKRKETEKKEPKPIKKAEAPKETASPFSGSENAKKVLMAFKDETEMSDTLSQRSGVTGGDFIVAVTELEIKKYITAVPVGRYKKN